VAFGQEFYHIWLTEKPNQYAASLAYYALFSIVPVIYIAFTLADMVVKQLAVGTRFYVEIARLLGDEVALALQEAVRNLAARTTTDGLWSTVLQYVVLAFSASIVFAQLQHTLNVILHVPPPSDGETKATIRSRLAAFVMVFSVGLLLIVAAVADLAVSMLRAAIGTHSPLPVLSFVGLSGVATLAFALIYKLLPRAKIAWRDVWLGALVAGLLCAIAVTLLGSYLGSVRTTSASGAAGAIAVLLVAFNGLGQIFVLGAVLNRVYAAQRKALALPAQQGDPSAGAP
jgi:membrane protein